MKKFLVIILCLVATILLLLCLKISFDYVYNYAFDDGYEYGYDIAYEQAYERGEASGILKGINDEGKIANNEMYLSILEERASRTPDNSNNIVIKNGEKYIEYVFDGKSYLKKAEE